MHKLAWAAQQDIKDGNDSHDEVKTKILRNQVVHRRVLGAFDQWRAYDSNDKDSGKQVVTGQARWKGVMRLVAVRRRLPS